MPTFKHPCPHCGSYINRDVVACPACGRADPFAPARCPTCKAPIDDLAWVACPKCGTSLLGASDPATSTSTPVGGSVEPMATPQDAAEPSTPASTTCAGCGSPLPVGARFCRECGTAVAG